MILPIELKEVRHDVTRFVSKWGVSIPDSLPLIDSKVIVRNIDDVVNRALALHGVLACAVGFSRDDAIGWLTSEAVLSSITNVEREIIYSRQPTNEEFLNRVDCIYILLWSLCHVSEVRFDKDVPDTLIRLLPDLIKNEPATRFRNASRIRTIEELALHCDLAYCLHWAVRQSALDGHRSTLPIEEYAIRERRRALEWLLYDIDWEDPQLDT